MKRIFLIAVMMFAMAGFTMAQNHHRSKHHRSHHKAHHKHPVHHNSHK